MTTVFFSYSHADEALRDKLESHLAVLKRQGAIEAWHDRRITAGSEFVGSIDREMERADIILLLVSHDFLNSDYCYDVEMSRALARNAAGEATVIPVILKPCDWKHSPMGSLLAAPRDGKPIVSWPDQDEGFLDVVTKIRAVLATSSAGVATRPAMAASAATLRAVGPRSSNLRMTKNFTEAQRDRFLSDAFDFTALFFENSMQELADRNEGIESSFRRIDANKFTGVLYQDGQSIARCRIRLGGMFGNGIDYSPSDTASDNSTSDSLRVEHDAEGLFLRAMGMGSFSGRRDAQLTFEGAAEYYWAMFVRPLQTERRS